MKIRSHLHLCICISNNNAVTNFIPFHRGIRVTDITLNFDDRITLPKHLIRISSVYHFALSSDGFELSWLEYSLETYHQCSAILRS